MKLKDIYIRDPYILAYGNTYYMYGKAKLEDLSFCVYKSKDLDEWSEPQKVFTPDTNFWADRDFWAPEVHLYKDKFYMFASFKSEDKCRGTQILVSEKPDGNFVPLTSEPVTPRDWECLDGTLYIDKKGHPHIVFCHEWLQVGDGMVCEMELSDDLKCAITKPRVLWKASQHPKVVDLSKDCLSKITDGPFFYRLQSGKLVCIWSSFIKNGGNGYVELVSESDNGDIDGNWSINEKPLFSDKGGHGMVFETFDGKKMFVLHSPNVAPDERAVMFELLENENEIMLKD